MHMIHHGMWDVFELLDPKNPNVTWDLFNRLGRFPLKSVISHVQALRATADKYTLDNLDWSGEYLRNTLNPDLLTKALTHVNIAASGPEILSATLLVIHSSNFEVMETVKDQLRDIKLSNYPWENIHDCCTD